MKALSLTLALLFAAAAPGRAISIVFDYTRDANGFFAAHPLAQTDLEAAAQFYNLRLTDTLTAIVPGGGNTWSAVFTDPGTGTLATVDNPTIGLNQIRVYVGGFDLGGNTLGLGGPGGFSVNGSQQFVNTVVARGQAGALANTPTDFGPWGGSIRFDLNTNWYFDADPATLETFPAQEDFYSTALHELGHVLGIGTAGSWNALVSDGTFTGARSASLFGAAVPLDSIDAHWQDDTMSTIFGSATAQEAAMTSSITSGSRKLITTLDAAGLQDVGWTVVPEPAGARLLIVALGAALLGFGGSSRRPAAAGRITVERR